ncbi:hypothetical protein ACHQM5_006806 [Ranunculus cassubicifolius]
MDKWLYNVDSQAREVDKLRKEINEIRKGGCPSKSRLEIHKKVIEILGAVAELKRIGNCNVLEHRIGAAAILEGNGVQCNGDGRSTETVERFLSNIARERPHRFSSKDIESFTSNFAFHLGHGGYGEVYKGQFPTGVQIAVKVLKDNVRDVVKRQFMAEVGTMGRTYHRNLVRLYGYCFETDMKALVYEFMEKGSLDKILYENHFKLEWEQLYDIATETAKGLSYLHENCHKRIIHCDIKAGNVLIDSNLCPKVSDFGLAKLCNRDLSHFTLTRFRGTPGYAAPEVWMPLPVTYKCDVYSFGMMLFEILGRKKNYNRNLGEGQKWFPRQVWEKFESDQLEEILRDCGIEAKNGEKAKTLTVVALWCAQYVPQNRPSMSTVVKILEGEIKAANPPNPFPHMVTSGVASMISIESTESVSSLVSSEVDTTSKGNPVRPKVPISFSCVSSEDSPVFAEW